MTDSAKSPTLMCRYTDNGRTLEVFCKECGQQMALSLPLLVSSMAKLTTLFSEDHKEHCPNRSKGTADVR